MMIKTMTVKTGSSKEEDANPSYPRGSDVPFPYPQPYPQQADLMECVLQALRCGPHANLKNTDNNNDDRNPSAKVLFLESPTGTGKSLSLACAALAWLEYQESCDLQQEQLLPQVPKQEDARKQKKTVNDIEDDWLDAWVSPEQREKQREQNQQRDAFVRHRNQLEFELSKRRQNPDEDNSSSNMNKQQARIQRRKQVQMAIRNSNNHCHSFKKRAIVTPNQRHNRTHPEEPFCLEDYHSDEGEENNYEDSFHWESNIPQLPQQQHTDLLSLVQDTYYPRKIIYAARTHSQLSQFVSELRKIMHHRVSSSPPRVVHLGSRQNLCTNPIVRKHASEKEITEACLDLQQEKQPPHPHSKKNNHNNPQKRKQNPDHGGGCPWLSRKDTAIPELALQILSQPADIEEVAGFATGEITSSPSSLACGYYASRLAVATAQVIVLPYSMLLNPNTRQSVGLHDLSRAFVIVDEAHNLPEAIRNLHACKLSSDTIDRALQQLQLYVSKYTHRLAGRNLFYLGQIRRILLAFQKYLKKPCTGSSNNNRHYHHHLSQPKQQSTHQLKSSIMQTATELLIELKLDNINIFRILRYLSRSKLSQKLLGFTKFVNQQENSDENSNQVTSHSNTNAEEFISKHVSAMSIVEAFLEKLTLSEKEGKIVTDWPLGNDENLDPSKRPSSSNVLYPTLRYVLLHPAACFENVVKEAHAVALVGGTLRPFAHVAAELLFLGDRRGSSSSSHRWLYEAAKADELLQAAANRFGFEEETKSASYVAPNFTAFTCDHVVPAPNVLLQCLARGPTGTTLDFRFQSRSSVRVMEELGRTLIRICQTVPGGVVVFLPSYSYEAQLVRRWKSSDDIWQGLSSIKKVHREPKSSQNVDSALQAYARDASTGTGAILFSIVGGKMSEGINFADDMARCVCCVGLPYPDITDPELVEKMATLDAAAASSQAVTNKNDNNDARRAMITGQAYYQNLCMRAVNQSVGRAIRHANDYAAVVLLDQRYTTDHRIWAGLPNWIQKSDGTTRWREDRDLEERLHEMEQFFRAKASSSV